MSEKPKRRSATPWQRWWSQPHAVGVVGLLAALMAIALSFQISFQYPATAFPKEFHNHISKPILALEVAKTAAQAEEVLGTSCPCVTTGACEPSSQVNCSRSQPQPQAAAAIFAIRLNTYGDFLFIILYALFLWGFAMLFAVRTRRDPMPLGYVVACVTLVAAFCDVIEDVGIFRELNAPILTASLAGFTSGFSRLKWSLLALALVMTAMILLCSTIPVFSPLRRQLVAAGYLVAGVLILLGVTLLTDQSAQIASQGCWRLQGIQLGTSIWSGVALVNVTALLGWKPEPKHRNEPETESVVGEACS